MIINIQQKDFGGRIRSGDILGVCNLLEHIRIILNNPYIKIYLPDESIEDSSSVKKFREFLKEHTDYFSDIAGDQYFQFEKFNVWDYRSISGDLVQVDNTKYKKEDKICIFPLFDAQYNIYRNWSIDLMKTIIQYYQQNFKGRIIVCTHEDQKDFIERNFLGLEYSYDYDENIQHLITCKYFAGGDTGTSHLAGSLINRPKNLFFYSAQEIFHTFPLNFKENEMVMYSAFGCKINVR
jgi:ADP-heptose:LPS heptosyltransferase